MPELTEPKLTGLEFTGNWIGETMGAESPGHLWEIKRSNDTLIIGTRWEGELAQSGYFSAKVPMDAPSFEIHTNSHIFTATLVDSQHFIIRDWDTNDIRASKGRHYDVVFSRPGLAELNAHDVWQRHKAKLPKATKVPKRKTPTSTAGKLMHKAARQIQTKVPGTKPGIQ
jgi:hypothetical protein